MTIPEKIRSTKAQLVKAESDSHTWQVAEDEEKYLEAYDRGASLEVQLENEIQNNPPPTIAHTVSRSNAMLDSLRRFSAATVTATDGLIGHVKSLLFDDQSWTIRYLVVDTGSWLFGREVLISPYSVCKPLGSGKNIDVILTREQVKSSPDIDTHQPVSRQHEVEYLGYYAYPAYWGGSGVWDMGAFPVLPSNIPRSEDIAAARALRQRYIETNDIHLRSSTKVIGYDIHTADGSIGHIEDFIFDEQSWTIRYAVVDTRNWWPGGRKVLIAIHWVDGIDWGSSTVHVKLSREQVKNSPEYQDGMPINHEYEKHLHHAYNLPGYWEPVSQSAMGPL
jgi:hypothetical protein